MFSSIRAKLLAILLPLFLISFVALSAISYNVSNNALVDDADRIAAQSSRLCVRLCLRRSPTARTAAALRPFG